MGRVFHETAGREKEKEKLGCVWGIGERKWRGEFGRRMMMLERWKEQEKVERVQEKILRWVDRETPGYIVRKSARGAG
jgi:hypothetical protein